MIEFDCPHCRQHIEADDAWAGLTTKCPTCSNQFVVPCQSKSIRVETLNASPCESCGHPLREGDLLCVQCGFRRDTGQRLVTSIDGVKEDNTPSLKDIGSIASFRCRHCGFTTRSDSMNRGYPDYCTWCGELQDVPEDARGYDGKQIVKVCENCGTSVNRAVATLLGSCCCPACAYVLSTASPTRTLACSERCVRCGAPVATRVPSVTEAHLLTNIFGGVTLSTQTERICL